MKKIYFITGIILLFLSPIQAQLKLHNNGHLSLGSNTTDYGIQIQPNGFSYFRTTSYTPYTWANLSMVNDNLQKHWIVASNYGNDQHFYVFGNGNTWAEGYHVFSNNGNTKGGKPEDIGGQEALGILGSLKGYYFDGDEAVKPEDVIGNEYVAENAVEGILGDNGKRKAGLLAEELDVAFPEAVRTAPDARLGIDYASVIALLVSAVNEQQAEINRLKGILEKNGLLKP